MNSFTTISTEHDIQMLAQQQDREDEVLLQHIIFLGEQHALDALK